MPPRQTMTRDVIQRAAFAIARKEGADALNARSVARALGCSTQPIFSCYESMAELRGDVLRMAEAYHVDWFDRMPPGENLLADVGVRYIDFALEEPNLFKLLFLSDGFADDVPGAPAGAAHEARMAEVVARFADPNSPRARRMLTDMWAYAHGIASMLVTNQISLDHAEIRKMIADMYHMIENKNREELT